MKSFGELLTLMCREAEPSSLFEFKTRFMATNHSVRVTPKVIAEHFFSSVEDIDLQETFCVYCLDMKCRIINWKPLFKGTVNVCNVAQRDIFRFAIMENAVSVIVAHNHPTGDLIPSKDDYSLTKRLVLSGEIIGIPVKDHIIVSGKLGGDFETRFLSLYETGDIQKIKEAKDG